MNKTVLPILLAEKLENTIYPTDRINYKAKSILFVKLIYEHYVQDNDLYKPMSKKYLVDTYGGKYSYLVEFLLENKFIETFKFQTLYGEKEFSKKKKLCKRYCINKDLLINDTLKTIEFIPFEEEVVDMDQFNLWALNDLKQLTVDMASAAKYIKEFINKIDIKHYKINHQIEEESICLNGKYQNKDKAILEANNQNKDLIRVKRNEFIIMDIKEFIDKTKKHKLNSYNNSIQKIHNKIFSVGRNDTNRRLDTNATNLNTKLINYTSVNNEHIFNTDLSNSQFCILSHILSNILAGGSIMFVDTTLYKLSNLTKTKDLDLFIELSQTGQLYEETAKILNLKGDDEEIRKEAKSYFFQIAFCSYKHQSQGKKKLQEVFPSLFEWIKEFKKTNGDEQFSIMLQNLESSIFIDIIYKRIKELGYWCLTKHDSFLSKESEVKDIRKIVVEELTKLGIKHHLKQEGEKKETKPISTSTIPSPSIEVKNNRQPISSKERDEVIQWLNELYSTALYLNE